MSGDPRFTPPERRFATPRGRIQNLAAIEIKIVR
jgi:hypothetical protein